MYNQILPDCILSLGQYIAISQIKEDHFFYKKDGGQVILFNSFVLRLSYNLVRSKSGYLYLTREIERVPYFTREFGKSCGLASKN